MDSKAIIIKVFIVIVPCRNGILAILLVERRITPEPQPIDKNEGGKCIWSSKVYHLARVKERFVEASSLFGRPYIVMIMAENIQADFYL